MPYGVNAPSDLIKCLVDKKLVMIDCAPLTLSVPGGETVATSYGPSEKGKVYIFYHISFGDITAGDWHLICEHTPSAFRHECNPLRKEAIDIGCPFWAYLTHGAKFKCTFENLQDTARTFKARLWQLTTWERLLPDIQAVIEDYCEGKGIKQEIRSLKESIDRLNETLKAR